MTVVTDSGFIALHRRLQDHWIYDRADWLAAWIDILLSVNWREGKHLVGDHLVTVPRGAMVASERYLAERWSRWGVGTRNRVRRLVGLLEAEGMIERREINPRITLVSVCNYSSYQMPGPRDHPRTTHEPPTTHPRATHEPPKDNKKNKGNKGTREQEQLLAASDGEAISPPQETPILEFPVTGNGNGQTWGLTEGKLQEYVETYPGADRAHILAELRKARQWCRDNTAKRKTPRGMPRFLSSWLARAQDDGGIGSPPSKSGGGRKGSTHHLGGSDELRRRAEEIDRQSQEMNQ